MDSNLALCDPQIRDGEEVLECVCLAVGNFHFSMGGVGRGGGNCRVGCDECNQGAGFKWRAVFLPPPPGRVLVFQR